VTQAFKGNRVLVYGREGVNIAELVELPLGSNIAIVATIDKPDERYEVNIREASSEDCRRARDISYEFDRIAWVGTLVK